MPLLYMIRRTDIFPDNLEEKRTFDRCGDFIPIIDPFASRRPSRTPVSFKTILLHRYVDNALFCVCVFPYLCLKFSAFLIPVLSFTSYKWCCCLQLDLNSFLQRTCPWQNNNPDACHLNLVFFQSFLWNSSFA